MPNSSIYTVGGTVQAGGGIYIKRKADDELLQHCRASEFAFILSSRQVGKSSLMVRTAQQLELEGIRSVIIDLSSIGVKISADEWYLGILNEIANTLKLKTDIFTWWSERARLSPTNRLTHFFRDVLLKEISQPIVLFFDEIDSTLSISFSDDFFASLRSIYNARSSVEDFKRLSFVMIGVATPGDLISDSKRTPFNIGHRVELTDFTPEEALPLSGKLGKQTLNWVFNWTNGHPYLTQRLCAYLSKNEIELTEKSIAKTVKQIFEGEEGWRDNNLQFVRDMLTKRSPDLSRVLKTFKDICAGKKVTDDERSIAKAHLKISGIVRSENGILLLRNQIYKTVFSVSWAQENIPQNRAKIASMGFAAIALTLLVVLVYDFIVGSLSSQYAGNFYTSRNGSEKLKNLAGLFELKGILQNTDYDYKARELFYSLNWNEQIDLFTAPNISPEDKQKYLPEIVNGLYVTMANIDGQQDSSDLLKIMKESLKDVKTPESLNLQTEIGLWLEARSALTDQDAFDKYNKPIQLNNNNPATHYERALIELRMGLYEEALLDLDTTMGLAQNLSSEESEQEISTPTPWLTKTRTPKISSSGLVTPSVATQVVEFSLTPTASTNIIRITETPFSVTQTVVMVTPTAQPGYITREGYRSSFYSIAYIRGALDIIFQAHNENKDFQNAFTKNYFVLTNLTNTGLSPLDPMSEIRAFATGTARAKTETAEVVIDRTQLPTITFAPSTNTPIIESTPTLRGASIGISEKNSAKLVLITAGQFRMGSTRNEALSFCREYSSLCDNFEDSTPQHTVYLDEFWIAQYEVTNAQFAQFVAATGYVTDAERAGQSRVWNTSENSNYIQGADWRHPQGAGDNIAGMDNHPVVQVSWNDANAYCTWAGRRLPTEAEWEKAARGDTLNNFPWGSDFNCSYGNYDDETRIDSYTVSGNAGCDGYPRTAPVGSFPAGQSSYGVFDMSGNVYEWVADWFSATYYSISPESNPRGPSGGTDKIMRGGSWFSEMKFLYIPYREAEEQTPTHRDDIIGFRCAQSANP